MNSDKNSSLYKIPLRLLGLIVNFIITVGILNLGCSQKEDTITTNDEYYIKYEVSSSTIYSGGTLNVLLKADDNQNKNFTIKTRSPWETIIGPVKKGFSASLSVSEIGNNFGHLTLQTKISVSKNGSSFALKKNDDNNAPRTSVQINYTIDY